MLEVLRVVAASAALMMGSAANAAASCAEAASVDCYESFQPPGAAGALHYYASQRPASSAPSPPVDALIALHGHPRDADRTFDAALQAVKGRRTLVVAPVFQVATSESSKCSTRGVPEARPGDLLWTCSSWLDGGPANDGDGMSSFAALDALVIELLHRWPGLRRVTIAGFSAGAQMVQHYIGFAHADMPKGVTVRYVVADPGTWLYFDAGRPEPLGAACPAANRWKYGTDDLPAYLGRSAAQARERYAQADIRYLEGELDSSSAKGTFDGILDKSCAALAQGRYRLQRGLSYARYDRTKLAPDKHREVVIVPGCAHDVRCVFASPAARAALLGPGGR